MLQHSYYLTHWKWTCALIVAWAVCCYWAICYKNAQNIYFERRIQDDNWCLTDLSLAFSEASKRSRKLKLASCVVSVQPPKMLMCPQGPTEGNLEFTGQQSLTRSSGFFICVWKETRGQASLCCFPVSNVVLAPIHRQPLIQHSWLEDHFSSYMSAKRKQEGKGEWSYEVKIKKIKIPGSCSEAVAAAEGNSLFGESGAWFLIKPHESYSKICFPLNCTLVCA